MTATRRYGEDNPFGAWVRLQPDLDSVQHSLTVNDADWIFHKYRTHRDGIGTREVQCMMFVEVKTNLAIPKPAQSETLFFIHQRMKWDGELKRLGGSRVAVRCFGVFVLCLLGCRPTSSSGMSWGHFDSNGTLLWSALRGEWELKKVLAFDIDPHNLKAIEHTLRRHHKTTQTLVRERTDIGIVADRIIVERS